MLLSKNMILLQSSFYRKTPLASLVINQKRKKITILKIYQKLNQYFMKHEKTFSKIIK